MTKYFLLLVLAVVVVWWWRNSRTSQASRLDAQPPTKVENMVACAHCGVNQPLSDSILAGGRYYCCAAHRQAAESTGS